MQQMKMVAMLQRGFEGNDTTNILHLKKQAKASRSHVSAKQAVFIADIWIAPL